MVIGTAYLDQDGELLFIGPEAERRFGHRHFMEMTSVFTVPPQFTVLEGRWEIGEPTRCRSRTGPGSAPAVARRP